MRQRKLLTMKYVFGAHAREADVTMAAKARRDFSARVGSWSRGTGEALRIGTVDKASFLDAIECPTKGWYTRRKSDDDLSRAALLRIRNGIEVGRLGRSLFDGGILVGGKNFDNLVDMTISLIRDASVRVLFEATFRAGGCVARADVIERDGDGWHVFEVKSGTNKKKAYIYDVAYTASVMRKSGFKVNKTSLMLVSKDYRMGMQDEQLFETIDVSHEVEGVQQTIDLSFESVVENVLSESRPSPVLSLRCRNCPFWDVCLGKDWKHSIIELPRISQKLFHKLVASGTQTIAEIQDESHLSERQSLVRRAVMSQRPVIDRRKAESLLSLVVFPAKYLDFESVSSVFPLYPNVAPYEQVPTQFSIHTCDVPGKIVDHVEYLADSKRDCRLDLARALVDALKGHRGSIVVYSGYELQVIRSLAKHLPQLENDLLALTDRLFDLEKVFANAFYHPAFYGRTSIKYTLPALVGEIKQYDSLGISDGQSAAAAFEMLARGEIQDEDKRLKTKQQLLEYCSLDTAGMVLIHQTVHEMLAKA